MEINTHLEADKNITTSVFFQRPMEAIHVFNTCESNTLYSNKHEELNLDLQRDQLFLISKAKFYKSTAVPFFCLHSSALLLTESYLQQMMTNWEGYLAEISTFVSYQLSGPLG